MFSKILVATDLSEASQRVVSALAGLRPLGTREALLVHCVEAPDVGGVATRQILQLARPSFEEQKRQLDALGFRTDGRIALGIPHVQVNQIADEETCSLIVVGSQGHTMAGEILLGGIASAVVHSATKPVLVIRLRSRKGDEGSVCEEATCNPLEHVLFPTDFSDNAERAFAYVEKIAECGARRVTLLHVQDQVRIGAHLRDRLEEFNRIDTDRLERLKAELVKRGVPDVRIELPYGLPKQKVVERTRQGDLSLVVMGSQGRGYFGEVLLGSVSHVVARRSPVPVLLVPPLR